ncbi:MAG: hypothetical protein GY909_04295 [Oligoflexia bacterium]|nr:hypothetical protein [Oligoflexia bacterium]
MDQKLESQLQSGIRALEDLYQLGNSDISPILDRLHFHFSEIYRGAVERQNLKKSHYHVVKWLERRVDDYVKTFYQTINAACDFTYVKKIENFSLERWNNLFEVFPKFIGLTNLFYSGGNITISITPESCKLRTKINPENLLEKRDETYRLYRYFFSKRCMLTYKISEESDGLYIEFDLNTQEQLANQKYVRGYELNDDFVLGLSDGFTRYSKTLDEFFNEANLGKHPIFVINSDGTLLETDKVTRDFLGADWDGEILHFAFLFRPISFIIPSKGKRITKSLFREYKTGCLSTNQVNDKEQDVVKSHSKTYKEFDFFSIFNK